MVVFIQAMRLLYSAKFRMSFSQKSESIVEAKSTTFCMSRYMIDADACSVFAFFLLFFLFFFQKGYQIENTTCALFNLGSCTMLFQYILKKMTIPLMSKLGHGGCLAAGNCIGCLDIEHHQTTYTGYLQDIDYTGSSVQTLSGHLDLLLDCLQVVLKK